MGRRGAYRKEDRVGLPKELQMELVDRAAARRGNCKELAKALGVPKSSVHYYRTGRLTLPASVLERMLEDAGDEGLERRVREAARDLDRTWANYYSSNIMREMYRQKVRLPTLDELQEDDNLRRKAAAIVSYVMAEGSVWIKKNSFDEGIVNITLADHETDLYEHFRGLCIDVFGYDIGPPQPPGNGARAIRGFIYSRFVAEWLVDNGVPEGEKSAVAASIPEWAAASHDHKTLISALQPWFDGEGCAYRRGSPRFVVGQSRHTTLDLFTLPHNPGRRGSGRFMTIEVLARVSTFDIPALTYCRGLCRSEVLDQVALLTKRLGLHPRTRLAGLRLNDNGFWSASWTMSVTGGDAVSAADMGLITQRDKLKKLKGI